MYFLLHLFIFQRRILLRMKRLAEIIVVRLKVTGVSGGYAASPSSE